MSNKNTDELPATITALAATEKESNNASSFFQPKSEVTSSVEVVDNKKPVIQIESRLRDKNMLVPDSDLSAMYYDEYRRIKRPLLSNAFGKSSSLVEQGNLILITSSLPGEGKTHTAINLALSMANERDHTVLLVDCDVARRGASRLLGIADAPGLVDVLEDDDLSVGDVLLRTDVAELCLLSAGKQHQLVTELLASQKMRVLVEEIASRYEDRIIIFDGPPLLPTPETQVLTGLVGQVVFVIEAGATPRSVVDEALNLIPENQAVGLIMNKNEGFSGLGSYYGYYAQEQV